MLKRLIVGKVFRMAKRLDLKKIKKLAVDIFYVLLVVVLICDLVYLAKNICDQIKSKGLAYVFILIVTAGFAALFLILGGPVSKKVRGARITFAIAMLYMLVLGYSVAYIFDGRTVTAAAVLLAMYFVECVAVSFVVYDFLRLVLFDTSPEAKQLKWMERINIYQFAGLFVAICSCPDIHLPFACMDGFVGVFSSLVTVTYAKQVWDERLCPKE